MPLLVLGLGLGLWTPIAYALRHVRYGKLVLVAPALALAVYSVPGLLAADGVNW